mgnify:CR=1 FL=1
MPVEKSNATAEAEIRALIETRVRAIHAKAADTVLSDQAPNLVLFDAPDPLQYV